MTPPLPSRIPCISLHQPYAELVVAGIKTIETRTWEWPYEPGWLAIHAAKRFRTGAVAWMLGNRPSAFASCQSRMKVTGAVIGMVYVAGCRAFVRDDEFAACLAYEPKLFSWPLAHARRLKNPIVMRGPQKIVYLDRNRVEEALGL